MRIAGSRTRWQDWLAKAIFAGAVFLLPVENASAVANLNLTTTFTSADPARANAYMDSAGTWNGITEVTNSTTNGDRFTLRVANTGVGVTDAFDVDITVTLPSGFRLPNTGSTPVTVTSPNGCNTTIGVTDFSPLNASQSGLTVDFNIPNNRNIPATCIYDFTFGITTRNTAPFATPGLNNIVYNVNYDDGGPPLLEQVTQPIQVNTASFALTKTAITTSAANSNPVDFLVVIRNVGTGGIFNSLLTDTLSANLTGLTFTSVTAYDVSNNVVVLPSTYIAPNQYRFPYIPPNVRFEIGVRATSTVNPADTICPDMTNDATVVARTGISSSDFATVDFDLANSLQLTHDLVNSYCELCGVGEVRVTAQNTGGISLVNIDLTENLGASGLTYVNNSTTISINGGPAVAAANPLVGGANGQLLTWTPTQIPQLAQLDSPFAVPAPPNPISVEIRYRVQRAPAFNEEGLISAIRNIEATADYALICNGIPQNTTSGIDELPIRQPIPQVVKSGRNTDAGQGAFDNDVVYGHVNDDVIWQVNVQNGGLANMEDLLIDDTIGGNFDINWVCSTAAAATNATTIWPINPGTPPAGCVSAGGGASRTTVLDFAVDDPFGNPANDENTTFIDVPATGNGFIYYVGRILGTCSNHTNTANIEWGCEADSPPEGGITIPATTGGVAPAYTNTESANLSAQVVGGLTMAVALTGSNVNQPVGTKGLVTITITNNTGATVRLWDNNPATISLRDVLPTQYVMDTTFVPTAVMVPAYGNAYAGMVDSILHTNPQANPLANTSPEFRLFSSTVNNDPNLTGATYDHMIRNGDQLTIQFGIVLIDPTRYDLVANLDVAPEIIGDGTDPNNTFTVANSATVFFRNICSPVATNSTTINGNYPANPEDIDVLISDALFILTNDPGTPLALNVDVTNNGGHDADDYFVYISLGQTMELATPAPAGLPAGCAVSTNPPAHPTWNFPDAIPGPLNGDPEPASVYVCNVGVLAPGATQRITFNVIKSVSQPAIDADDLTFRADVIGEITLSDGTPLTFPNPASITNTSPNQQLANNYTLDAVRSRVLGFNLNKTAWYCTESGTVAPTTPTELADLSVITLPTELNTHIGEDCHYFIESGGWFGFLTPGFTLIAVENVRVTDDLPNGQGFIPFDGINNYDYHNTSNIALNGVDGGAVSTPLGETDITWEFNVTGSGIVVKDEFFRVNLKTRLLNDPLDASAAPNLHALLSTDIARTSFDAIFNSVSGNVTINVSDTAAIPGYPVQAIRQEDLTVIEPNVTLVKTVCNETLYGNGPACSNFVPLADDGDTQDSYVFRVEITNEATSGGVTRAPAYDVTVFDTLDPRDQMFIMDFATDNLDNDGDGAVDEADESIGIGGDGIDNDYDTLVDLADPTERVISDNTLENANPAVITTAYTHSAALLQINPGSTVTFYYRVNPADSIAPLQTLTNTVYATYDSLEGDAGNQNSPQLTNAETTAPNNTGRARLYTAPSTTASVRILPLQSQPKTITQSSNTALTGSPQNVVVGEEILFELHAQIPVAHLRDFVIRDELPAGIQCVETQDVDLNAAEYAPAGFRLYPSGAVNPVSFPGICTSNLVEWNFGNQQLTTASSNNLFDFRVRFIARVENSAITNNGISIINGGAATSATLTYTDETGGTVTLNYGAAQLNVTEPNIVVTKDFTPITVTEADADDILTVTVTATNNGTATAYNLEVLDDLLTSTTNLHYVPGSVGGTNPPDTVTSLGGDNDRPIFSWLASNPDFAIATGAGNAISFTYQVQADPLVQPHEILDNTIEARWTSLPSVNTTLTSLNGVPARTLNANGDLLGMRDGQLTGVAPVSANPPNDYNATATDSVIVPELTVTKNVIDPTTDPLIEAVPTIGEHQKFEIVISLPEGVSNGVTVTDTLNVGSVSYFLENDATYDVTYTFQNIATINGDVPSEAAFVAGIANPNDGFPADEATGTVTWDIGTVDTVSENDPTFNAVNPQIIITYYARINNDVNTDVGDTLQNNATLNYTNGETPATTEIRTDNTPAITVVEPLLIVDKVWSNVTLGKALGDQPDAGDILEYEITIQNTGNATAFDINIRDIIPASILYDGTCAPKAIINSGAGVTCATGVTNVAGFVATPLNQPAGPLIWGRGNADESLDLPVGDTLVLLYQTVVQNTVETNQDITNGVVIDWTSLNGANPLERNGGTPVADCSAVVAPDDYCAVPTVPATATVSNLNTVTKAYNSDTYAPLDDGNLRVGDRVQYTITMYLQEGTTRSVDIVDTLPNGMDFVSIDTINGVAASPNFVNQPPFTHADITPPAAGGNTITLSIGDVINAANNDPANDVFEIVYTAQVVNDELEPVQLAAPNNASVTLTNNVAADFTDYNNINVPLAATESITLQQPIIANITKTRTNGGPSGTSVISGEVIAFQLSACNTGLAPAYDVVIDDDMDYPLDPATITGPINGLGFPDVYVNAALATVDTDPALGSTSVGAEYDYALTTVPATSANMHFVLTGVAIDPGQCAVMNYTVQVEPTYAINNSSWDNAFQVTEYHSLTAADVNAAERETWGPVGPVIFNINNYPGSTFSLLKTLQQPPSYEATIGETLTYQITVPRDLATGNPLTIAHNDIRITDDLHDSLVFESASLDPSSTCTAGLDVCTITPSGIGTNQVGIFIPLVEANEQAVINVVARVANNINAQNVVAPFGNTASYTFAASSGGSAIIGATGSTVLAEDFSIIEPEINTTAPNQPVISVVNTTKALPAVDAGDILEYTLTFNFLGGAANDRYSDAYDIGITSDIGPGLSYVAGSVTSSVGTVAVPLVSGNEIIWDIANGTDIDVPEGTAVTFTYRVEVRDVVLASQALTNTTTLRWTSLNGANINERDGTGGVNDYVYTSADLTSTVTTTDTNTVTKAYLSDTSPQLNAANVPSDVRIGDIVDYQVTLSLQEGTSESVVVVDDLPDGLAFEGVVSINGDTSAPYSASGQFSYTDIAAGNITTLADTPSVGRTRVTWNLGNIVNAGETGVNDGNDSFVIVYRTRVIDHPALQPIANPASNIAQQNNLNLDYVMSTGVGTTGPAPTESSSETIVLQQPNLSVGKSVATSYVGVEDYIIEANEVITYTVTITNNGLAPAYDALLQDIIPLGLRTAGITVVSTEVPLGTTVANPTPVYDAAFATNGIVTLDFNSDSGDPGQYTIPANGASLRIVYQVQADASIGAGINNIINTAQVLNYYSCDNANPPALGGVTGVCEVYGPSNTASSTGLNTPQANPLLKENPPVTHVNIGEPFTYTITIPDNSVIIPPATAPPQVALYDVKITDNLRNILPPPIVDANGVDLIFVSVARNSASSGTWTPVNTSGDEYNLIIEDVVNGIDIPAGGQAIIDVTVVLQRTSNNQPGDTFANTANYTYNTIDNDDSSVANGGPSTTANLIIASPFLEITKTGPGPAPNNTAQFGLPIPYRLVIENTGTGPAYDTTVTDTLPDQPDPIPPSVVPTLTGGTCDAAPINFTAQVFQNDEITAVSPVLVQGTDFVVSYTAAPTCQLVITTQTAAARIGVGEKLIITYDAYLDADSENNAELTNHVSVTQYFSQDTPAGTATGETQVYANDPLRTDDESQYTIIVQAPELYINKTAYNVTTNRTGEFAEPGETLRYTILITNLGPVAANNFSLTDEPDALNGAGYFVPGSMANITVPVGADISNTNINGGANGAGLLDVRNLNLAANGATLAVEFDVTLVPIIEAGTIVRNQATIALTGFNPLLSDDPNIVGDTDPTETRIGSIPAFVVEKISDDITGDPAILVPGDVLRYTITAKNVGADNAVNTLLRDNIPANTTYVTNTTTLNGVTVADPATGVSPLQDGMLINAPEDLTPGNMRADSSASTANVATITFNVMVNTDVVNHTVISNQAFVAGVGAGGIAFPEQVSDDPTTEILGDPTRDVVGDTPILDAQKVVEHLVDVNGDGFVDPGDTLRYTITISNAGTLQATGVRFQDNVPANTVYVANSVTLNGIAIADVSGLSPLIFGIDVSSSDLTPPLPAANNGIMTAGQYATVIFDVRVGAGVPNGTVITNQGVVTSIEFTDELTDVDGVDANGDQPTEIIVGNVQQLSITKEVFVVGGGTAQPGGLLEYFIHVRNTGTSIVDLQSTATDVLKVYDDIDSSGLLTYVAGSARLNGSTTPSITFVAPRLTVNYDTEYGGGIGPSNLFEPGDEFTIRYLAQISSSASQGDRLNNTTGIDWGTVSGAINCASSTISNVDACAFISVDVGGAPGVANLSGKVWHDSNFDLLDQSNERVLEGWEVEIYFGAGTINPGDYLDSVFTNALGEYNINGLIPNVGDIKRYALRFRAPGASTDTASLGNADSSYTDGPQQITFFNVAASSHTVDMNLPIQPNGVVYDSITRTGVAGTRLELINSSGLVVPASCFVDPVQFNQRTLVDGYYKFELNFSDNVQCPVGGDYTIRVYPPSGYFDNDNDLNTDIISQIIPPALLLTDPAYDVPTCPNDAIVSGQCEVQVSEFAPATSQPPRSPATNYYLKLNLQNVPGDDQIYNNHIPVDPELNDALAISKTSAMVNVTRSQLVPYTITMRNSVGAPVYDIDVVDNYPAGFKYVQGSARIYINDNRVTTTTEEPQVNGLQMTWPNMVANNNEITIIKMLLVVGAGVGEGEYINRVQALNNRTNGSASGVASATVRVVPDPTFDCSDVIGKVFDDKNLNGYQDDNEPGLPGVRVVTAQGLQVTADEYGRFHIACALVPNPDRGSNFIVKLDERSLPTGYRMTTENPRVQRATRGKMLKYNFGAAIHRVVRLDMADAVFKPGTTEMRLQWKSRIDLLITELAKDPSILRLSYLADNESESLVADRIQAVKDTISERWQKLNCCYKLMIESEVFWRKGGPPDRKVFE